MKISELRKLAQFLPNATSELLQEQVYQTFQDMGLDPGSFYQELEMDSPYVDTHQDISYTNKNFQFHSHTFY